MEDRLTLLIVEDNTDILNLMAQILRRDYEVIRAENGREGLDAAKQHLPDIILLDVMLPELDGYEVLKRLRDDEETARIPVIFLTAHHRDSEKIAAGLRLGAVDYILKPFEKEFLKAKVGVIARLIRAERAIRQIAYYDPLTGVPNRQLFHDRLQVAIAHAKRQGRRLAVLFMDLDGFKQINDTYGHEMGDRLLQTVAKRLTGLLRESDTIARIGGDEFVILLPSIQQREEAEWVAQKITHSLASPFTLDEFELYLGLSAGISIYPDDGTDTKTLLKKADDTMYSVKKRGGHNYRFYSAGDA